MKRPSICMKEGKNIFSNRDAANKKSANDLFRPL